MSKAKSKFRLKCDNCGCYIPLNEWLMNGQKCLNCRSSLALVEYPEIADKLKGLISSGRSPKSMWHYFDVLPIHSRENIVSAQEGLVAVQRWPFLEKFARSHCGIECTVYAHRQDNNYATGSFKDLSGSLLASVLKENKIEEYVVASTGNIGVSYTRYISHYGGRVYVFLPGNAPLYKEAEISIFGQKAFRVSGDYARAKELSLEFANIHNFLAAVSGFDPMRIEAKRTMAFEWLRQLDKFPTVYIQALSGGTGPAGIMKGCKEMLASDLIGKVPRMILVQTDRCSPMADAWVSAKADGFKPGWENKYPRYDNPTTAIPTLATGNPTGYPFVAAAVRDSGGEIIAVSEEMAVLVGRIVAYESAVRIGSAAAVAVHGFFSSLKHALIASGDIVVINIGEGIRRDPEFMIKMMQPSTDIKTVNDCALSDRKAYGSHLWSNLIEHLQEI